MSINELSGPLARFFEDVGVFATGDEIPDNRLWRNTARARSAYPEKTVGQWYNNARLIQEVVGTSTNANVSPSHGLKVPDNANPDKETIDRLITRVATKHGIPAAVLKGMAKLESNWRQFGADGQPFNNKGLNKDGSVDWGILQINEKWHPGAFPQAKTDIVFNLEYGAKYLASQYKRYRNWRDALAAYNAGSVKRDSSGGYINQKYVDTVVKHAKEFGLA